MRIGKGFMDYIETEDHPWIVETNIGMEIVPGFLVGSSPNAESFKDYVEGNRIESFEEAKGIAWRLTAPGYMDSTDWNLADNEEEAIKEAKEIYDIEEESEGEE